MSYKMMFLFFLLIGCAVETNPYNKIVIDFIDNYLNNENVKNFENLAIEDQYNIIIYGRKNVHPPIIGLEEKFVNNGSVIVLFLQQKLKGTNDFTTIGIIIELLRESSRLKNYELSTDKRLIELMKQKASMLEGDPKIIAERQIEAILDENNGW